MDALNLIWIYSQKEQIWVPAKDFAFKSSLMLSSSAAMKAIVGVCESNIKVGENWSEGKGGGAKHSNLPRILQGLWFLFLLAALTSKYSFQVISPKSKKKCKFELKMLCSAKKCVKTNYRNQWKNKFSPDILTKYYSVSSIFMFVFKFVFCPHLSLYSIHIKICVCVSHRTGVLSFINIVPAIGLGSLWNGPEQIWASVNPTWIASKERKSLRLFAF